MSIYVQEETKELTGREIKDNVKKQKKIPFRYYMQFLSKHYKIFLLYVMSIIAVLLAYNYGPLYCEDISMKLTATSLDNFGPKPLSNYIQTQNSVINDELLKQLRQMQRAVVYLQVKQQAYDRRAMAFKQHLYKLETSTHGKIVTENQARNWIKDALMVYDADKLGLRDYALESIGGTITSTPNTKARLTPILFTIFGIPLYKLYSNPRNIIQPDVQPGQCFTFNGEQGRIRIRLAEEVIITAITMENTPNTLLTEKEILSTPKNFDIIGLENESSETGMSLGLFTYSVEGPPRQTFIVPHLTRSFQHIELYILSNHGNIDYTSVYRIRIHGSSF